MKVFETPRQISKLAIFAEHHYYCWKLQDKFRNWQYLLNIITIAGTPLQFLNFL